MGGAVAPLPAPPPGYATGCAWALSEIRICLGLEAKSSVIIIVIIVTCLFQTQAASINRMKQGP